MTVLDLTSFLSGPSATQLLGDLGAEVIKVEPLSGDMTRGLPPHFVADDSAYYLANNRNKRGVAIDMKDVKGRDLVERLIDQVDVVVENLRPGALGRLGLDVARSRARRPELIWVSISGFGQDGPRSGLPAYDMIVQALSGVMSLTGEPGRSPVRLGVPAGDIVAGLYAVIGLLAALVERDRTGIGDWIDASMLDGQLALLSYQAVYSLISGTTPAPQGSRHDSIPTYRTFAGSDGHEIAVTANTERMWRDLCDVLELPELAADERYANPRARLRHRDSLWAQIEPRFATLPAEQWLVRLTDCGIPAALIKSVPEALADARSDGRGMVLKLAHADGRSVEVLGTPIVFRSRERVAMRYPPALGEHTRDILTGVLGMSTEEIDRLAEDGVVIAPQPSSPGASIASGAASDG
ncbi:CoA transferase [Nocardia sp. CA2R105]|nr:CoA transferase [Nocardia coffeae]